MESVGTNVIRVVDWLRKSRRGANFDEMGNLDEVGRSLEPTGRALRGVRNRENCSNDCSEMGKVANSVLAVCVIIRFLVTLTLLEAIKAVLLLFLLTSTPETILAQEHSQQLV